MARPTVRTPHQDKLLFDAITQGFTVHAACDASGYSPRTVQHWRQTDDDFAEAYERARCAAAKLLEEEINRRAMQGILVPVVDKDGAVKDQRLRYSDGLLLGRWKRLVPDPYGDRALEKANKDQAVSAATAPVAPTGDDAPGANHPIVSPTGLL